MALDIKLPTMVEFDYFHTFDFERNFDSIYWRNVFKDGWVVTAYISAAYLVLIFGGEYLMKNRKPFKLNGILTVWNLFLSVMSITILSRTLPEFYETLTSENGLHNSICEWKSHTQAGATWGFLMMLSKVLEFGDTAFVVLRKQELKFIHYYHHVLTAVSWAFMYPYYEPVQLWYVVMNAFVHSIMYPYYGLRAMKVTMPKAAAMFVTTIQILQMFLGLYFNLYSFGLMYVVGTPADCPDRCGLGVAVGLGIYLNFTMLFLKFFITNYVLKGKSKSKKA